MTIQTPYIKIALAGKMRSGKGEAIHYLNKTYFNNTLQVLNFADPLYELCGMIQEYCGFPNEKDRGLLQYIGTDYGRNKDSNVWVNRLFKNLERPTYKNASILIGDARFTNEMDACRENNFVLVKIEASDNTRLNRGADRDKLRHPSELDLDPYTKYDFIIENNTTRNELHFALDNMMVEILNSPHYAQPVQSPLFIQQLPSDNALTSGISVTSASGLYLPS